MTDFDRFFPGQLDDAYEQPKIASVAPDSNDKGYEIGKIWIDKVLNNVYFLTSASGIGSTWTNVGNVELTPQTGTAAAVVITLNTKVGVATLTGITTAAAAEVILTITNSEVSVSSGILVTVGNTGTNDARMSLEQVKPAAGSFEVHLQNNGAAALNGNVIVSFIVLN